MWNRGGIGKKNQPVHWILLPSIGFQSQRESELHMCISETKTEVRMHHS